jgi:endoglucanase
MSFQPTRRVVLKLLTAATITPIFCQKVFASDFPLMQKGINLHHLLNWPDGNKTNGAFEYSWPPFQGPRYSISSQELRHLVHMGFDFVRITVDPSIFIIMKQDKQAFLLNHSRVIIKQCLAAGLKVIFDLHPVAVNPELKPEVLVDAKSATAFNAYADMVEVIAKMMAEFAPSQVAFELMNEPWMTNLNDAPRWQPMLEQLHARARSVAPHIPLILTGMHWSDYRALIKLDTTPFKNSNVLYTFHYYDPHTFTHQGVGGDESEHLSAVPWPFKPSDADETLSKAEIGIDKLNKPDDFKIKAKSKTRDLITKLVKNGHNETRIAQDFDVVARWAAQNGISRNRILLGEFGCVNTAKGIALGADRLAWLSTVKDLAQKNGFPWAYWSYKGYGGMELMDVKGAIDSNLLSALGLNN